VAHQVRLFYFSHSTPQVVFLSTLSSSFIVIMSRGGFGGGRGGFGGGANRSGPQQLMSFDLIKDLGVNGLFNVQTDLFPVSF
jgi:hypothetical protein